MAELQGKKRKQPSSCPEGWLPAAIVVQLELTRRQERYAQRCVGIARFVYNRMVANDQAGRDAGLWLTPHELEKEFNAVKHVNPSLNFVTEVSKFVAQGACRNYRNARSRWLSKDIKARRPVFHKKKRTGTGSFLAASGIACIRYDGHRRIRLPYLGSVKMTRALPEGMPYEVTIRKRNGRWWASVAYWKPPVAPPQRETQSVGGVDVGIKPLAVDSDYVYYENPKALENALGRLSRWQRAQARRTPGSRGWWEAQRRIDATQRRIIGLRNNAHHHVSGTLVHKYHTLGVESLSVAGMIRAGMQSKALSDAGMSGLLDQIRYKAVWYGTEIVEADRWFPSSKTCSVCDIVHPELGREPMWSCPSCGVIHDRNENAARNLQKLALLAVGEDVMLLDGGALAGDDSIAGETAPDEGRTKPRTTVNTQLRLVLSPLLLIWITLHRTGRVNVPLRNSWFLRTFSLTIGEECLRSVQDEAFRGLPLGISEKRHDFGGGGWCERVNTVHSVQDWSNLGKGDKVLVQVGDDEWQLKVLTKAPYYFEHFVGPCRDQLLEAHWIAAVRSVSLSELADWIDSLNLGSFSSPSVSSEVRSHAG